MPHSLVLNLLPNSPIPPGFTSGKHLHALFLSLVSAVDSEMGNQLHANQSNKAFTLSPLQIEMWSKSAFLNTLDETAKLSGQPIAKGRFRHCLGFMKLRSYREERLNWMFRYVDDLNSVMPYKVQVLKGIGITQVDNLWARHIDKQLKNKYFVCYILPLRIREIRYVLELPMHFQIYPIADINSPIEDFNPPYSIAFGQSALLLDSVPEWKLKRLKASRPEIFIAARGAKNS